MAGLEYDQRKDGKHFWRLRAFNGKIIAGDANQGFENYADCVASAEDVVSGRYAVQPDLPTRVSHILDVVVVADPDPDTEPDPETPTVQPAGSSTVEILEGEPTEAPTEP